MKIEAKRIVSIHYKLTDSDGEVIDSSEGQDPLMYLHGANNIIHGLERALEGKVVGDQLNVTIQPEDGYGPVNPDLIQTVPRSAFQNVEKVEPGMKFEASAPGGEPTLVTVERVTQDEVTVNGNHPLAGQVLNFDVSVSDIREASEDEADHGHVH